MEIRKLIFNYILFPRGPLLNIIVPISNKTVVYSCRDQRSPRLKSCPFHRSLMMYPLKYSDYSSKGAGEGGLTEAEGEVGAVLLPIQM